MEKFVSFVIACILAAGVSYAAGSKSEPVKQPVVTSHSAAPVVVAHAGEHDYKLERESCCGPQ